MEHVFIIAALAIFGVLLGSFAGASVWRLRAKQLFEDKRDGEKVDAKEYSRLKKLTDKKASTDRSVCLSCGHQLAWYDLFPLISWVQLKGKCRYCHKRIGYFEPLVEIGTAAFFVLSFIFWPYALTDPLAVAQFVVWLICGVGLVVLFVYDLKWFLLPNVVMFSVIGIAAVSAVLQLVGAHDPIEVALDILLSGVVLSGLYYVLYLVSKGQWIGFGDIKLGIALALLLADWQLALLTLFLANLIGCIVVIPAMKVKKLNRYSHVPFGPMLIAACFIAMLFGHRIIGWYLTSMISI